MCKESKYGSVFLLLYLAYVSIYAARVNLSVASPAMLEGKLLTEVELGVVGSAFSVIYACGRMFNGVIGDRRAPWILIACGLITTGGANLLLGILPPYVLILGLWSINAFAQSMLWGAILRTMTALHSKEVAQKKVTLLVSSVSVGNIVGILLNSWLVSTFGIRTAFLVPGAISLVLGILAACWLSRLPQGPTPEKQGLSLLPLLKNKQIRGILLLAMFHGVMKDNISLWMMVYFLDTFSVNLEKSAWYVLLIPTMGLVGRLLYPVCYTLCKRRENLLSGISFALCAVLAAVLCFYPATPLLAAACLSLIYCFVSMINTSILSMFPLRFAKENMVSSVSGIADLATYLGAAIGSAIYGIWIAAYGYFPMFLSWVVLSVLSIGLLLLQIPKRLKKSLSIGYKG